jgi:hypothetical protein
MSKGAYKADFFTGFGNALEPKIKRKERAGIFEPPMIR